MTAWPKLCNNAGIQNLLPQVAALSSSAETRGAVVGFSGPRQYIGPNRALSDLGRVLRPADLKPQERLQPSLDEGKVRTDERIHVLAVALAAVFVASVVVVSTASAAPEFLLALWLEGTTGTPVTATLAVVQSELELIDTKTFLGESKIKCSGIFLGNVGPESKGEITELQNLAKEKINLAALSELGLACTDLTGLCPEPLVWFENLPWKTEAELMVDEGATFFVDLISKVEFEIECMGGFIKEDLCSWPTLAVQLTNETGGVIDASFSDAFQELAGLPLGTCTLGAAESLVINGLSTISESGVTLTVSE